MATDAAKIADSELVEMREVANGFKKKTLLTSSRDQLANMQAQRDGRLPSDEVSATFARGILCRESITGWNPYRAC